MVETVMKCEMRGVRCEVHTTRQNSCLNPLRLSLTSTIAQWAQVLDYQKRGERQSNPE